MKKVQENIMIHLRDVFTETKQKLEKIYGQKIENLRQYFDLSDTIISSLALEHNKEVIDYQRVNTYILANNFEYEND
jgi:hypothetical protein